MINQSASIIEIENLKNYLGGKWVHDGINLTIDRGEIIAIIGGSGCGKTTLLRSLLMLQPPTAGTIKIFGTNIAQCSEQQANKIRQRWGVMFQSGALFSSLTLLENIMFPLQTHRLLNRKQLTEVASLKICLAGLELESATKYPAELSGGMIKRAALARAIALDPELVFLDEPTTGLDPYSASALDELLLQLRDNLGLTLVMVTHDLDTLWRVPDRIVFLGEGKALAVTTMEDMVKNPHPLIKQYFSGYRSHLRQGTCS